MNLFLYRLGHHSSHELGINFVFSGLFRPVNPKGMPRMGRRGSLPLETSGTTVSKGWFMTAGGLSWRSFRRWKHWVFTFDLYTGEASYAYKWMQIFPYNEDEDLPKRRSSGGPELFAAAAAAAAAAASSSASVQQEQGSSTKWKAQVLFNNKTRNSSSSINASSSSSALGYYWPGAAARRRGSLPLEVCIASSDSCSCESESSGRNFHLNSPHLSIDIFGRGNSVVK